MQKKGRIYFEHKIGETPKNEDGDEVERTVVQWNKILEDSCKAFHPLGATTGQMIIKWDTLKWNPNVETIEDFVHKVNQLAKVLKKTEADKVLKIKIASPNKDMLIMTCTSVAGIVSVINQKQAMNWLPSPGPNTQLSTQGLNSSALNAHVVQCTSKTIRFEVDKLENTPDWPECIGDRIASKVNDKISKLAKNINKRSQDRDHRITEMKITEINVRDLGIGIETDIVMVIGKKDKGIMKNMVLVRKDINLPVDTIQENQRKIQEAVMIIQHLTMKT